jgi:hypothetical protein
MSFDGLGDWGWSARAHDAVRDSHQHTASAINKASTRLYSPFLKPGVGALSYQMGGNRGPVVLAVSVGITSAIATTTERQMLAATAPPRGVYTQFGGNVFD